ncbi:DUF3618 domain-containing protein [Kineococcus sp. SYSU DK006]|uniref:DUF3618 domain-containing protein n=1 Tax=Kineococcus sp. SYSU DK006 TaxID=3383127 RepID=UPI003D7EB8F2
MSETQKGANGVPTDRAALERDIEITRDRLAATADALAAKADVKAQAQHKVDDVKAQALHKVDELRGHAASTVHTAGAKVQGVSASAPGSARQQSGVLLGAVVAVTAVAVWLVVRRR